jgi:hypothetical protein
MNRGLEVSLPDGAHPRRAFVVTRQRIDLRLRRGRQDLERGDVGIQLSPAGA